MLVYKDYMKNLKNETKRDAYINSKNIYNSNVKKYLDKGENSIFNMLQMVIIKAGI